MPAVTFHVRWPDGDREACYSPSTVIYDYLEAGRSYTLAQFVDLVRAALNKASERVAMRYGGSGCSHAMAQLAAIEAHAEAQAPRGGDVYVERFEP